MTTLHNPSRLLVAFDDEHLVANERGHDSLRRIAKSLTPDDTSCTRPPRHWWTDAKSW